MCEKCDRDSIEEIGEEYCPNHSYCIFKEFLVSSKPNRRMLVQLVCIDKLKFIKSKESGKDIGWKEAFNDWINEGLAEHFSEIYTDKKSINTIFKQTIGKEDGKGTNREKGT